MDPWDRLRFLAYQEHLKDVYREAEQERLASLARLHKPVFKRLLAKAIEYIGSLTLKRILLIEEDHEVNRRLLPGLWLIGEKYNGLHY